MSDLGYKPIFDKANQLSTEVDYTKYFDDFHNHPELFHFIMAPESQQGPDEGALLLASRINNGLYKVLKARGPSLVGNGSTEIDGVESRHILLMTFLLQEVGPWWGKVLEIGGGYGNCQRLASDTAMYYKWDVIDLDYILNLQKYVLRKNGVNLLSTSFISYEDTEQHKTLRPDVVLGIHSLSEFSLEDFKAYFEIIKKARWFYYVTANAGPSVELVREKLDIISKEFLMYKYMDYEGSTSTAFVFRNRTVE